MFVMQPPILPRRTVEHSHQLFLLSALINQAAFKTLVRSVSLTICADITCLEKISMPLVKECCYLGRGRVSVWLRSRRCLFAAYQ